MSSIVYIRIGTSRKNKKRNGHLGEAIYRGDGTLEYLKTYRLSGAQTRRVYLLSQLAAHHWDRKAAGESQNQPRHQFIVRLENAGFGYLLKDHILKAARKAAGGR